MNEDKVKEAMHFLATSLEALNHRVLHPIHFTRPIQLLNEAMAPEQPEIPEGCPVIVYCIDWCDGREFFYNKSDWKNRDVRIEIDYQRKEHVIPWGGEGKGPVNAGETVTIKYSYGRHQTIKATPNSTWSNVVEYVIWSTHLTEVSND